MESSCQYSCASSAISQTTGKLCGSSMREDVSTPVMERLLPAHSGACAYVDLGDGGRRSGRSYVVSTIMGWRAGPIRVIGRHCSRYKLPCWMAHSTSTGQP